MRASLEKYGKQIEDGKASPIFQCEETNHGLIFDPANEKTPLLHMAFGRWYLQDGEIETVETKTREYVMVPMGGVGRIAVS